MNVALQEKRARKKARREQGQSLIELIIALAIGVIVITATINIIALSLRSDAEAGNAQVAGSLLQEYRDAVTAIGDSDWVTLYCPPSGSCPGGKGAGTQYHIIKTASSSYGIALGATSTLVEGKSFTKYLTIENVNRTACGVGNITTSTPTSCTLFGQTANDIGEDPSTQKITMKVEWQGGRSAQMVHYITRRRAQIVKQSDWSGGTGQEYFPTSTQGLVMNNKFSSFQNIDATSTPGAIRIQGF